jgi:hypothetical protein
MTVEKRFELLRILFDPTDRMSDIRQASAGDQPTYPQPMTVTSMTLYLLLCDKTHVLTLDAIYISCHTTRANGIQIG